MNETPEMVRRQMDQTKTQLAEKFESLEYQVSETVQSAGSAVNSTVEAVDDVLRSVTNVLDLRRQIDRHPWLVLGGAAVLGYLAVGFLTAGKTKTKRPPEVPFPTPPSANDTSEESERPRVDSAANATTDAPSRESVREGSSWDQLRETTIGALISVVPGIASHVVPRVVERLIDRWDGARTESSNRNGGQPQDPLRHNASTEALQSVPIASRENVRSRKRF